MATEIPTTREQVAAASRRLAASGLVLGTAGNVSARSGELIAITPTGARLESLEAEQVTVIDLHGRTVAGELAPTSELDLHLGVFERYGAGAVVHTHQPLATALGLVIDELPAIHYQMLALGGAIRVAPYRRFGTRELAEVTLAALEGRAAAIMANHGAIAFAQDLERAIENVLLLEWACGLYWRAAAIGTPRPLGEQQLVAVAETITQRGYGAVSDTEG